MTIETGASKIPDQLKPLFKARTASEVIEKTIELLQSVNGKEQKKIIKDSAFGAIVKSALINSDQRKEAREKKLFESIEEDNFQALDDALHQSPSYQVRPHNN